MGGQASRKLVCLRSDLRRAERTIRSECHLQLSQILNRKKVSTLTLVRAGDTNVDLCKDCLHPSERARLSRNPTETRAARVTCAEEVMGWDARGSTTQIE